jgi:glycerol kinase
MYVLALDQSTSATKALIFDPAGRVLDRESRDHRQHYPQPGWVEHDAEEIWQNTLAVLRTVVARHPDKLAELTCLSLTNQRETVVVFARGTGRPLHPAIVWQCRRGDPLCAAHAAAGHEALIHARTGLTLDAYFSASKLQWLGQNRPDLRAQLAAGEALIGTIDTYLIYRLTGGRVFATDTTNASRTLLFDLARRRWDDELCALWQVPPAALAEVRDCSAEFGETTLDGTLARPLPICGVMGDSQASLFAQRCFDAGSAKATFGTGTSVLLNIGEEARIARGGVLTALAWTHQGRATYAFEGIITCSAATLTWLRDQLGLIQDVRETEALARAVADNGGVYLVPAFSGLGAPHWRESARAAIVGLSAHSDRRHVVRAALEAIAYQLRDVLDAMRAESGVPLRELRGDGGATTNAFLMQFVADLTGVPLRVATHPDFSPLGAAMMGLLGRGRVPSIAALAAQPREERLYAPSASGNTVERLYAGWQHALVQVLAERRPARVGTGEGAR